MKRAGDEAKQLSAIDNALVAEGILEREKEEKRERKKIRSWEEGIVMFGSHKPGRHGPRTYN